MSGMEPSERRETICLPAFFQEIIPAFFSETEADIEHLRKAIAAADEGAIRAIAHTLQGLGGSYGFHYVTDIGKEMGQAAKSGDLAQVESQVDELESYLKRVDVEYEE